MAVAASEDESGEAVRDWELVRRVVAEAHRRILARMSDGAFHEPSFGVLSALLHAPGRRLPMSQLAREAVMTTGGFTRLADRLGRAGLIDRRGSDEDRRVVYASLTAAGLREARRLERRYHAALRDEVLELMGKEQLRAIAEALRPIDTTVHADQPAEFSAPGERPAVERRRRTADGASGASGDPA
jgi:DNA-binding MarR family transcriptional regulator